MTKHKFIILDECDARSQGRIKGMIIDQHNVFSDGDGGLRGHCPYCIHKCLVRVAKK